MTLGAAVDREEVSMTEAGPPSAARQPVAPVFSPAEVAELPDPVRRHLTAAIAPGTPLARSACLRMRGRIKIGAWLPFRAREVLSPHDRLLWTARVAGVVTGSDRYVDGAGRSEWALAGRWPLAHAEGPDVARSAAGRAGAEAIWVPTALLPRFGVRWSAAGPDRAVSTLTVDGPDGGVAVVTRYRLDDDGRIRTFVFARWGDPDATGTWGWHPFGGEVTAHRTFDGVTVPAVGRVGWFFGTDRWPGTVSFRFRLTAVHLTA
jgi:hypothetical protein